MTTTDDESRSLRIQEKESESKSSFQSLAVLVVFNLLLVFTGMHVTSIGPFFPTEARDRNISVPTIGLIVAILQLSQGLFAFLFLLTISEQQKNKVAYIGFVLSGTMCVLFGESYNLNSKNWYVFGCFLTRVFIGMGGAAKWATTAPILIPLFPARAGVIFSGLEISFNFGMMIAPPLCSWLYSIGGYTIPFVVIGFAELCVGFLCFIASRSIKKPELLRESQTVASGFNFKPAMHFLSLPGVWAVTFPFMAVLAQYGFLSVTLAVHLLDTFNLNGSQSGYVFLIHASMATLTSVFYGYLIDKGYSKVTFLVCLALTALGYFILALPFFGFDYPRWTLYAGPTEIT